LTLGHDFKKGPIPTGCRKRLVNFLYRINGKVWMVICGIFVTHTDKKEYDYSYYLGPGYKDKMKSYKKCSTIVSNHVSWVDTQNIYQFHDVAFALDAGFVNVPLMGKLGAMVDSIFIPRGGTEEKRLAALNAIKDRQTLIEEKGGFN
tara:strand:+ start:547 stop:987 length:441 start_codon:yes stop_codon:yes gene_type:complete